MIRLSDEVREALAGSGAVVALETTLVAQGFPPGEGVEVGIEAERQVRGAGAVPATIGVLEGELVVGLSEDELTRFVADARKVGPRDVALAMTQRVVGATTVGGTLAVARAAGISWLATGGLGGVHRGWPDPPDVSADLAQLARTPVLVVCAGVKSLLDVPATADRKSTRLNSSHVEISYAVFCLKKKKRSTSAAFFKSKNENESQRSVHNLLKHVL